MMTIQHALGMKKSYTEKLMAMFNNVSYIIFLKSTCHCDNGQNNENHWFSVWDTPVWFSSHVCLRRCSFYIGYCISNSSLAHNSTSQGRAAWMGQPSTTDPAPETVPQYKGQCDAKACVTLYAAEGLGGLCVHVIVTDARPCVFSLMHRNLWESDNTTESISKEQLLLWETLFFSDTAIKYNLSSQYSVFYISFWVHVNALKGLSSNAVCMP